MALTTILFDLDGTLIDSREDITASVNSVRAQCRLPPLAVDVVSEMVGLGIRILLGKALGEGRPWPIEEAIRRFRGHYRDHCLDRTFLYGGVRETLESLDGLSLGVVTNKPEEFSRKILEGLGVASRFAAILGGDSTPEKKPHPEPIFRALRLLGAAPRETLFVGDSPVDVTAARRAGVRICGVTYGLVDPERMREAGPDHLIDRMPDLIEVIRAAGDGVG